MAQLVLAPLGIQRHGFGAPKGDDAPWGHGAQSRWAPKNPRDANADNPIAISAAGRLHLRIADWGRFIAIVLSPALAEELLGIRRPSWLALTTAGDGDGAGGGDGAMALGWFVTSRPWARGRVLDHAGSNTYNHSCAWLAPDGLRKPTPAVGAGPFAALVCTNSGAANSDPIVSRVIKECTR